MKTTAREIGRPSVRSGKGLKYEESLTIHAPVQQVFRFWRRLENLPRFMRHLENVTETDSKHSRWTVRGPGSKRVHWDAEIIEERENEMISWHSLPGAEVHNAGSVWFRPAANEQGTILKVSVKYSPPAGKLGAMFAKLFGKDAARQVSEDLRQFKSIMESGESQRMAA